MGRKPLGHRALSPAERQKKWRLQHPAARQKRRPVKTATADDFAERQAVIKACTALVESRTGYPADPTPRTIGEGRPMAPWP